MLKCLVVDDEFLARQLLEGYISRVPTLELVALCESPTEAIKALYEHPVDIIFLDVNMPELSGIDFIKTLKRKPEIILTTAYSEHALEGYQLDVIEYLLKPIYFDRFLQAVNKAQDVISMKALALGSPTTGTAISGLEGNSMFIKTGPQKITRLSLQDILYIESMHEYVRIHLKSLSYTIYHPLKSLMDVLPADQFIQIHRSFIINFSHVSEVEGNMVKLGTIELSLGKNYRDEFMNRIRSMSIGINPAKR